jgi:hypothetical protein
MQRVSMLSFPSLSLPPSHSLSLSSPVCVCVCVRAAWADVWWCVCVCVSCSSSLSHSGMHTWGNADVPIAGAACKQIVWLDVDVS